MDRLREDYRDGERFYATDMNQMTHVINELGDQVGEIGEQVEELTEKVNENKIKVLRELPEEGESGVIYSIPKKDACERDYLCIANVSGDSFAFFDNLNYDGREFKIGDVIKVNSGASSVVIKSVNEDELTIDFPFVYGVSQWSGVGELGGVFQLTDIVKIKNIFPKEYEIIGYNFYALVFVKIESESYDYVFDEIPSVFLYVDIPIKEEINAALILDENDNITPYGYDLTPIKFKVGDKIHFNVDDVFDGVILPTEVDETNLSISYDSEVGSEVVNGILSYITPDPNGYYVVSGVYDPKISPDVSPSDDEYRTTYKIYTFDVLEDHSHVDYELDFFKSIYGCHEKTENNNRDECFWNGDHYELIGGNVSSKSITNIWKGTQEEYDSMSHNSNTLYIITDEH